MYLNGVYVDKLNSDGKWHVCQSGLTAAPAGRISATGYDTRAEALEAVKRQDFS